MKVRPEFTLKRDVTPQLCAAKFPLCFSQSGHFLELSCIEKWKYLPGASNLWPVGCMQPGMAVNVAQHKTVNLLKTF